MQRSGQGRLKPQHLRPGTRGELSHPHPRPQGTREQSETQESKSWREGCPEGTCVPGNLTGRELEYPHLQGSPLFKPYWKPEGTGAQMMLTTQGRQQKGSLGANKDTQPQISPLIVFSNNTGINLENWAPRQKKNGSRSPAHSSGQPGPCTPHRAA